MAQYVKGDIVLTPFPFSSEQDFKVRPALVLAVLPYGGSSDYLVCIVSTQAAPDPHLLELDNHDITGGALSQRCYLRPGYVYSVGESLIKRRLGTLKATKLEQVVQTLVTMLTE
jgi:mRNA interferase MazF